MDNRVQVRARIVLLLAVLCLLSVFVGVAAIYLFEPVSRFFQDIKEHQTTVIDFGIGAFLLNHFWGNARGWGNLIFCALFIALSIIAYAGFTAVDQIDIETVIRFLLLYSVMLFVLLSDILQLGLAHFLTRKRGPKWVKELDYVYLGLATIGIFGSINRIEMVTGKFSKIDILAPLVLATAIVIRVIKTRAEIGGWNKPDSP